MTKVNFQGAGETEQARNTRRIDAAQERGQAAKTATPSTPAEQDAVQFSARASVVSKLTARVYELPEVRQDRVEALQAQVYTGSFRPPSEEVARAIISYA